MQNEQLEGHWVRGDIVLDDRDDDRDKEKWLDLKNIYIYMPNVTVMTGRPNDRSL